MRLKRSRAFSLLEVIAALAVIMAVIFLGKKFLDIAMDNSQRLEEARIVESGLDNLITALCRDFESAVLLDKNQPIVEICERKNGFKVIFFTAGGERHITSAVEYDVAELGFGRFEIIRTELSPAATLNIQESLHVNSSLKKLFATAPSSEKLIRKLPIPLSDFKVRIAIKTYDGRIIFSLPNKGMVYVDGALRYKNPVGNEEIHGDFVFLDVTARALRKSDASKLAALGKEGRDIKVLKGFLYENSLKNFVRITPLSLTLK